MNKFRQLFTVARINLASLPKRAWVSTSMIIAIAMVVFILLGALALDKGMEATLDNSGSEDIAVILSEGATSEGSSSLSREQYQLLAEAPGIAVRDGVPQVSNEFVAIIDGVKKSTQMKVNLPLRGVDLTGPDFRQGFRMLEGRMFRPATNEIIVGKNVVDNFDGFDLDQTVRLGKTDWLVVGVFEAGGSVFESEIWADRPILQSLFDRGGMVQSIRARLDGKDALADLRNFANEDPRLQVKIETEAEYFAQQSARTSDLITMIGRPLAILMSFGALAGAINAAFNSIGQRSSEIATLRTIGFGRHAIFIGTMTEMLALGVLGGILGVVLAFLAFNGLSASTLGSNFTQVVFELRLSWREAMNGVIWAISLGLIGGLFPAWQASRRPIVETLG